jgi:hypothetical protein
MLRITKVSKHNSCVVTPPRDLSLGGSTLVGFFFLLFFHPHKTKHIMIMYHVPCLDRVHCFDHYSFDNGCGYTKNIQLRLLFLTTPINNLYIKPKVNQGLGCFKLAKKIWFDAFKVLVADFLFGV